MDHDRDADTLDLESLGISSQQASALPVEHVRAVAATLDLDEPSDGELPLLWHWAFFNPTVSTRDLGPDGHPARTHPAMMRFPRRMWAGGSIRALGALRVDHPAVKRTRLVDQQLKQGSTGALLIVALHHTIEQAGAIVMEERQDLVFREAAGVTAAYGPPAGSPDLEQAVVWRPNSALLFRYSALTFNGHRIHYDRAYATDVEGYPDLVVHGPLTATMLAATAAHRLGRPLTEFSFRGAAPLLVDQPVYLTATVEHHGPDVIAQVAATRSDGVAAMSATAR